MWKSEPIWYALKPRASKLDLLLISNNLYKWVPYDSGVRNNEECPLVARKEVPKFLNRKQPFLLKALDLLAHYISALLFLNTKG